MMKKLYIFLTLGFIIAACNVGNQCIENIYTKERECPKPTPEATVPAKPTLTFRF